MEGQGVGGYVSDVSSPFFTMVANGVETMRFLRSFLVRVMRRALPLIPRFVFFFLDVFKWC